ncbi:hypothetical protein [Ktedonospora formicarum]|uniref:Uncharacterized protein n=1 Tax=Ktedonospora formicarum TaxID=2778364 RepID=A0A8J3I996_9CHLR|nr:hypothetical protein [Ktedonospora formicarum]GHO47809.1 hypothetical protein KSX_59720 [Ktedonospora formicarum]
MAQSDFEMTLTHIAEKLEITIPVQGWKRVEFLLPFLEQMRQEGAIVLIKFDGEKSKVYGTEPYTVSVIGAFMGEDFFRIDSFSLEEALIHTITHYTQVKWKHLL